MKIKFITFFKNSTGYKIGTILFLSLLTVSFQNCGKQFQSENFGKSSLSSLDVTNPQVLDVTGAKLYTDTCSACHGALAATTIKNKTLAGIKESILTQNQMKFIKLSDAEINRIVSALNFKVNEPTTDDITFKTMVKNRYMLSSDFIELFVNEDSPNADDTAIKGIINNLITSRPEAFGGNCQRNDPGCLPTNCGLSSDPNDCRGRLSISTKGDPVPQLSAISNGYLNRACEEILKYDRAVENVLKKSGLTLTTPVNASNVTTLSTFIFSGKIVSTESINQSINISNAAKAQGLSLTDQWRFIVLPFCISSNMHLL